MDNMTDRLATLEQRAHRDPPRSWAPDDAKTGHPAMLGGRIVEKSLKVGRGYEGRDVNTVTIETAEGAEWTIWLFHQVLEQEFRPLQVGDVVLVKYEGLKEGRDRSYKSYRVLVDQHAPASASAVIPPESAAASTCDACGFVEPEHASGCPNDIPF